MVRHVDVVDVVDSQRRIAIDSRGTLTGACYVYLLKW